MTNHGGPGKLCRIRRGFGALCGLLAGLLFRGYPPKEEI